VIKAYLNKFGWCGPKAIPRQRRSAAQGYSMAVPSVFVEWLDIERNQNFDTSLYRAKTMMLRTNTSPI
jgi:hypothetical protein